MTIKTTVDVNYNVGVTGNHTGKVIGLIESCAWADDFETVGVNYVYLTEQGQVIHRDGYTVKGKEQIDALYSDITGSLTDLGSKVDNTRQEFYAGFAYVMAQTFGLQVSDIEII